MKNKKRGFGARKIKIKKHHFIFGGFVALILIAFFVFYNSPSVSATASWYNSSWNYRLNITINHSEVDANLTNFPIYLNLSALPSGFHTNVNSTGKDIRITLSDGTTEVPREVVSYDSSTDKGELWFKGNLSTITDTVFYIYYGNAAATEPAANSTYGSQAVWSDYTAVLHMTAAGNAAQPDSTANANNFTPINLESGDRVAGKFTYALDFDGVNEYLSRASALFTTTPFTISAWGNYDGWGGRIILSSGDQDAYAAEYGIATFYDTGYSTNLVAVASARDASNAVWTKSSLAFTRQVDFLMHGVFSSTTNRTVYYNGGNPGSQTTSVSPANLDNTRIGRMATLNEGYWDGRISEVRIRPSALTSTWISTEYNNQNSPSTFYSVGSEEISDTCTCAGLNTNWNVSMADNCVLSIICNLGTGNLTFYGTGSFTINSSLTLKNMDNPPSGSTIWVGSQARTNVG